MIAVVANPALWRQLLPDAVVVVEATAAMWSWPPSPAEARCVHQAVPQRRAEFQAGRAAARAALRSLGIEQFDLLSGPHREPLWPKGVVGSITHTLHHCASAVARQADVTSLGIDLEAEEALSDDLIALACSEHERKLLLQMPDRAPGIWAKLIFSAKEAFFKAYYPHAQTFLEFHDVGIALDPQRGEFEAQLIRDDLPTLFGSRRAIGRYAIQDGLIYTALATPAPPHIA